MGSLISCFSCLTKSEKMQPLPLLISKDEEINEYNKHIALTLNSNLFAVKLNYGHFDECKQLYKSKFKIDCSRMYGGQENVFILLIKQNFSETQKNEIFNIIIQNGGTLLINNIKDFVIIRCIEYKNYYILKRLIEIEETDLNITNEKGQTPLMVALIKHDLTSFEFILSTFPRVDINIHCKDNFSTSDYHYKEIIKKEYSEDLYSILTIYNNFMNNIVPEYIKFIHKILLSNSILNDLNRIILEYLLFNYTRKP